jgi:hypothetical protein
MDEKARAKYGYIEEIVTRLQYHESQHIPKPPTEEEAEDDTEKGKNTRRSRKEFSSSTAVKSRGNT